MPSRPATLRVACTGVLAAGLLTACSPTGPRPADSAVAPPPDTAGVELDTAVRPLPSGLGDSTAPPAAKEHFPTDGSVAIAVSGKPPEAPAGVTTVTGVAGEFFTADGQIACALTATTASCAFPAGFSRDGAGLPNPLQYCATSTALNGVTLGAKGNAYRCGGEGFVQAAPRTPDTAWAGEQPALVTAAGQSRVALAEGRGLAVGDTLCVVRDGGVACGSAPYGSGFTLTPAGISFYGTRPADHSQYG